MQDASLLSLLQPPGVSLAFRPFFSQWPQALRPESCFAILCSAAGWQPSLRGKAVQLPSAVGFPDRHVGQSLRPWQLGTESEKNVLCHCE